MRILKPLPGALPMPERNIVGDWPMNSLGGRIFDRSGNDHTGTLVGDTHWVLGKFGPALRFDGTSDYVIFGNVLNTFYVNPYTINISLNISSNPLAPSRTIFSKSNGASAGKGFGSCNAVQVQAKIRFKYTIWMVPLLRRFLRQPVLYH